MTRSWWTLLVHSGFGFIAFLGACSDGSPTDAARVDPLAETQAIRVRVNTELTLLQTSGPRTVHRRTQLGQQSVLPPIRASLSSGTPRESRTIVKHFRQLGGKTLSLAWHFRNGAELPTLIYVFENGRIQSVAGLAYSRHGSGYLRRKVRLTTFDSTGKPHGQINVSSDPSGVAIARTPTRDIVVSMREIASDVLSVILPASLHAEEGPCTSEYLSYLAASAKLAAATAALEITAAGCIGTGVTCPAAGAAVIAWLDLLDKWNLALDKLLACTEAAKLSTESRTSPDGGSSGDDFFDDDYDAFGDADSDVTKTVQEFIDDSIAAGTFQCSSDGNVCTYYAE